MSDWTDIGEQLKATREERGLELPDVVHQTRIPLGTLRALEANDYSGFPSPSYAKSFLAQYSDFLQIDADDWLDCFETGNVLSHGENLDYLVPDDPAPSRPAPRPRASHKPSRSREPRESNGNLTQTLLILVLTAALIGGAIWGFLTIEKRINTENPEVVDDPATTPNQGAPASTNTPAPSPTLENTPVTMPPVAVTPPSIGPGPTPQAVIPPVTPPDGVPVIVDPPKPPPRAIIVEED
ncbi:MAG: helix-turn-helix domain-containing protein [Verrucomicrobiaceae bacterium]